MDGWVETMIFFAKNGYKVTMIIESEDDKIEFIVKQKERMK